MKAGDLEFISGTYYKEKSKTYPHNMVHIEIWLGDEDKTIGARWKTGNHCNEHSCKYSIFFYDTDNKKLTGKGFILPLDSSHLTAVVHHNQEEGDANQSSLSTASKETPVEKKDNSDNTKTQSVVKRTSVKKKKRQFFIGGNNGVAIIEKPLLDIGLERTTNAEQFFFKWVEIKRQVNYDLFRPGEQIVNHIPSINCLTTKTGLVQTLREYERLIIRKPEKGVKPFKLSNCFMESYLLNSERSRFLEVYREGEIWIVKPAGMNQGKGIYLINDVRDLDKNNKQRSSNVCCSDNQGIVQRYIMNPLLVNGYKFDIRVYMLIAATQPYLVFYHKGYVRLSCVKYSNDTLDLQIHLTNQFVQKKHPLYAERKEETVLSFEQLNQYINLNVKERKHLVDDWVYEVFTHQIKEIMLSCFLASKRKLEQSKGLFELLGFDFMIDENMKVWLIEININPALHTNCTVLNDLIPPMIDETLNIVMEIHEKQKIQTKLHHFNGVKHFEVLYNSSTGYIYNQAAKKKEEGESFNNTCAVDSLV